MKKNENEILATAQQRYRDADEGTSDERELCKDDILFAQVEGQQWDSEYQHNQNRPRFEINKIAHSVNQIIGEYTQNSHAIKVRPAGGKSTRKTADVYSGLIRNIQNQSNFDDIKTSVFKEVCNGGMGAMRVITDFLDPESFEQDIRLEYIPDAVSCVYFSPFDKTALKRDSDYCFVVEDMPVERFKLAYPNAAVSSLADLPRQHNNIPDRSWLSEQTVRIAEYFTKTKKKMKLLQLSDGRTVFQDDVKETIDELLEAGIEVIKDRDVDHYIIEWYKISGSEILEGPTEWPGRKHIPVIPTFGFNYFIDGRHHFRGMVRMAKDAQRIYNYSTSAMIEAAAKTPKDPIFMTAEQMAGHEDRYKNFNLTNDPFLLYNAETEQQSPFKLGAPVVQTAMIQQTAQADADLQATLGRSASALGDVNLGGGGNAPSGLAVKSIQNSSNVGQQELFNNMNNSIEAMGDVLLDILPRVYDTERQVRIIQPDGKDDFVTINEEIVDVQTGESFLINDINQGKYDFVVTTGANFETQRDATLSVITQLAQSDPEFMRMSSDLILQNLDHPMADEFEKRARKRLVAEGIVEPNEEELPEIQSDQEAQLEELERQRHIEDLTIQKTLEQSDVFVQKTLQDITNSQVENQKKLVDIDKTRADINKSMAEAAKITIDSGLPLDNVEIDVREENVNLLLEKLEFGLNTFSQQQVIQQQQMALMEQMQAQSQMTGYLVDEEGNMFQDGPDGPQPVGTPGEGGQMPEGIQMPGLDSGIGDGIPNGLNVPQGAP